MIIQIITKSFEELKKEGCRRFEIFKSFKTLDCEIRTISEEINKDRKEVYYSVEVGYYESIGERGLINTFFYNDVPTDEEILKEVEEDLKKDFEKYKNSGVLSANEEEYLKILKRILKNV